MNDFTHVIAIWGAITGTIGTLAGIFNLVLRYKQHQKDKPQLLCTADFNFEHSSGEARSKHKIVLRSIGKRPVTVDFIRYYIRPEPFWARLFRNRMWKLSRWIYDEDSRNSTHITEGKKEEVRIKLPTGLSEAHIAKVGVFDQSGTEWSVRWPRKSKVERLTKYERLHDSEEKTTSRICKVSGYAASGTYYIYVHWNPTPSVMTTFNGKYFSFSDFRQYSQKLQQIIEIQRPKLLRLESDAVE